MDINILVCSDLHASEDAAVMLQKVAESKEYDLVVVCGDFTTFGSVDFVKRFLTGFKGVKVLAVPGNCDLPETVQVLEKVHASVHNRKVEFAGWSIYGFGGSLPTKNAMPFEVPEAEMVESLRKHAVPGGIMVTHMPAFGFNDRGRSGKHAGSPGLLKVVEEKRPRLVLSGHMHESKGVETRNGIVFMNPGSARNGYYASVWLGREVKTKFVRDVSVREIPKIF
jgi:Icc-related predicted phosphoesterase